MECISEDRVKVLIQEALNSKVVYRDTCNERHEGEDKEMGGVKEKITTIDKRVWALVFLGITQLVGIIIVLIKEVMK